MSKARTFTELSRASCVNKEMALYDPVSSLTFLNFVFEQVRGDIDVCWNTELRRRELNFRKFHKMVSVIENPPPVDMDYRWLSQSLTSSSQDREFER